MDAMKRDKIKLIGDLINKYLELKPEYSGLFWSAFEFAEMLIDKLDEVEIAEFESWHDAHKNDPTPF